MKSCDANLAVYSLWRHVAGHSPLCDLAVNLGRDYTIAVLATPVNI